jgi:hypothetical protein
MNKDQIVDSSLSKLNELLSRQFQAAEPDFADKAKTAAAQLPGDLAQALSRLAEQRALLKANAAPDTDLLAEFAFHCGQVYEQLAAYRHIQMEMENVVLGPESVSATPLQASQIEPLARFIEVRDRIFRKVADFTLKALLIGLGLLTLGLVLGLI